MTALISITLLSLTSAWAQYTVKGQIVDAVGPVIGAAVLEQGTLNGTESDMDGNFTLTVSSASSMIEISLIGYKTLVFQADQVPPIVTLEDDTEMLEEVVVIGYGTVKKEDLTGSVATVRADQLNKGAVTSPTELLKGKSAGVVITDGDGAPGSGSTIRIRGGSSLNAQNSPLIVIDGLPITNEGISGVADQLSSINPSDIETFTVLKDASATAIYGSRASNGVIIITTKKGSKYDSAIPSVSADYTLSISQNSKYLDVMTGDEMRAAMLDYTGSETSEGYLALGDANTDWQRQIYQLGMSHEANVSLQGNFKFGEAGYMPYRVSGGYLNEKGTLKTSSMERGTIALNLTPTFFDDHLTISLNGKGMFQNNRFANTGAISAAIEYDPTQPVYSEDHGLDGYWMWGNVMSDGTFEPNTQATINPLAALYQRNDVSKASRFIGNAQFDYKIHGFEDLRLNLNLGMDYSHSNGTVTVPYGAEQSYHNQTQAGRGLYNPYDQTKQDMTLEAYADYTKEINKHSFGIMAGYSWQHFYTESNSQSLTQPDPVAGSQATLSEFHNKSEYFLVSFFGRANYNYDNRYMVTATVRWDGTSRFTNNKWGFFPSVALGWNIKGESFLKDSKAVSDLKLRLSWGQTGQQDIGDVYQSIPTYQNNLIGSYYMFDGQVIVPITPNGYNADLKWETTTTYNIGLDYGFLNDRLFGTLDVYYRETTDLLNYTPVAAGANLTNYLFANIGSLVNKGVEFEITGIPVQTQNWNWTIGANFAYNHNRITKLTTNDGEGYTGVATGGISGGVGNTIQRHMVGYPANTFYVYQQVYDENGAPIPGAYVDQNGDGVIDADDLYYLGQASPVWTIGFNTSVSWKNLTLAIAGHGNLGNMVYNNNASRLSLLSDLWTNSFVRNCMTAAPGWGFTNAAYLSDYWVEDGSFFKIDRITLSYLFDLGKGGNLSLFGTAECGHLHQLFGYRP